MDEKNKEGKYLEKENIWSTEEKTTEKEKEEIIWRRKIIGNAHRLKDRVNIEQPAIRNAR